jgi:hypothetical protein
LETAAPTASPAPALLRAYFVLGFGGQTGLVPVVRSAPDGVPTPDGALRELLAGPSEVEGAAAPAVRTGLPSAVELRAVTVEGGVAIVDLSAAFQDPTDEDLPTAMRVAQVVYTVTQFPGIAAASIEIEGDLVAVIGPDRLAQDRPFTRADFTAQLPPLFVDEPAWGATIASPVRVTGLANAFEATFELRIADAEGRGLAAGTVTATCGSGCWGDFSVDVPFSLDVAGPGLLQVYEESAKDGARQNLRVYPVTLVP